MVDHVSSRRRSDIMRAVRSKNTKLELLVRRAVWNRGIRYRTNVKDLLGKPDMAIRKLQIVVFIDSCFWHGCSEHSQTPKSNITFWTNKIARNVERDKFVTSEYQRMGWRVIRVWEHDVIHNLDKIVDEIVDTIQACKSGVTVGDGCR